MIYLIFNYDKLKDRMQQLRYNQVSLAKATNIERVTLNQKINKEYAVLKKAFGLEN